MLPFSLLLACCLLPSTTSFAQPGQTGATTSTTAENLGQPRATTPTSNNNNAAANGKDKPANIGCSRGDWLAGKCTVYPGTNTDPDAYPDRYPGQYPGTPPRHRRPIIIVPTPTAAPVDDTPLASDWEGCRKTKLNQLSLTQNGNLERAKQLDEWLWKNCRSYSEDLRQLEQDQM
jgi:hypothetical protein